MRNPYERSKTIPLRLLSLRLAAEDRLKQPVRLLPCFDDVADLSRREIFLAVSLSHVATRNPLSSYTMGVWMKNLGIRLCYEPKLVTHRLRRGAANMLALNCTEEKRCARMGHTAGDNVYWRHYRNECSSVDVQAIAHGVEAGNIGMLSSIALNRRPNAPQQLSVAGLQEVQRLPELTQALEVETNLRDQLLTKDGSMAEAAKAASPMFHEYDRIRKEVQALEARLMAAKKREEYRNLFNTPCPTFKENSEITATEVEPAGIDEVTDIVTPLQRQRSASYEGQDPQSAED